jgi:hypothetical protein
MVSHHPVRNVSVSLFLLFISTFAARPSDWYLDENLCTERASIDESLRLTTP